MTTARATDLNMRGLLNVNTNREQRSEKREQLYFFCRAFSTAFAAF
jgi:hypothetical protein